MGDINIITDDTVADITVVQAALFHTPRFDFQGCSIITNFDLPAKGDIADPPGIEIVPDLNPVPILSLTAVLFQNGYLALG
jgi:hypothetical protein